MNPAAAARRPSARLWRIAAGTVAGLLIVAAVAITALRLAIVYLPENATRLQAWIERETGMRIEYSQLDARLRWYGPELVLRDVRVLDRDNSQALFATRGATVALDVWNFFRTGQLVAGRVRFVAPRVTLVRLADGRFRLLGQRERPADRPPFDLEKLPAGRLVVEDATVFYRDLKRSLPVLRLDHLDISLRRDREFALAEGKAQLPQSLGGLVEFSARLKGSLEEPQRLDARLEMRTEELRLAGLQDRLPSAMARPLTGHGAARVVVNTAQGALQGFQLEFDLKDVALRLPVRGTPPIEAVQVSAVRLQRDKANRKLPYPIVTLTREPRPVAPAPAQARYAALQGDLTLRNESGTWNLQVGGLRMEDARRRSGAVAGIAAKWRGQRQSAFDVELEADAVDLKAAWPLMLAFAPAQFDRWAGLAPTGTVNTLRLKASRDRAGVTPTFVLAADLTGIGVQPHERMPGVAGITARVDGTDRSGTLRLRGESPAFDWPRFFRAPIQLERAAADVRWKREGAAWVISTRQASLGHAQVKAQLDLEFKYVNADVSPVLNLSATVEDIDVTGLPQFLPVGRMNPRTIAWLDGAFSKGRARNGKLSYRGPVKRFPFRNGEGEFTASVEASDMTLEYFPGFAPLTMAEGAAEFHNASIGAKISSGQIAGLKVAATEFRMSDYKTPVLDIVGSGNGDLGGALVYLQESPLGPRLGTTFMGLSGSGPARYAVKLLLPIMARDAQPPAAVPRKMDYEVRADLDAVTVASTVLRAPAQAVTGKFTLHNREIRLDGVRGTFLDGPFELTASPGLTNREVSVATEFTARGTAGGTRLPAFIGLPAGIRMAGVAPWELRGRIEKRNDTSRWPVQVDVNSTLEGLEISAPKPFAKLATEARPTRVRLEIPGNQLNDVAVESGTARAQLRFAQRNGKWQLERGAARFDAQPVALPAQRGLLITGDWPGFDLAEWLALRDAGRGTGAGEGGRIGDWLGPVDVHLETATVLGYRFEDLTAKLRIDGDTWRINVSGPQAQGLVAVPDDLRGSKPIVLDMKRLFLVKQTGPPEADGAAPAAEPATDPRTLPAINVRAEDFAWQGRQFGQLQAVLGKDPRGMVLQALATSAPAFSIAGHGDWFVESGNTRTRMALELVSTDLAVVERALGYRDSVDAREARFTANLNWAGGPSADILPKLNGTMQIALGDGQLRDVEPGAGRMLGLLSVAQLPRRLALDFRDVTEKGLAFDEIRGDFELRDGNAHTQNLLVKGPAVDIGVAGRIGLATEDYDQTIIVSGNPSGPLVVAGALAAGPVVGAGVLLLSQMFKGQLQGLTRAYYRVTGPWAAPVVERISASSGENAAADAASETTPEAPAAGDER